MDKTSEFYHHPTLKAVVRYRLEGKYEINPYTMKIHYQREVWSADRSVKQFTEKKSYIDGKERREFWKETLLTTLIDAGCTTMGDVFFNSSINTILLKEGLTEEDKI